MPELSSENVDSLRIWAGRYRQFASTLFDKRCAAAVELRARELEAEAAELEAGRQKFYSDQK